MELQQQLSILIVEDEGEACEIIKSMLETVFPQTNIYTAGDGQTGLDIFNRHQPAIVITDINMPVIDGFQMINRILASKPDTRIVVITAHRDRQSIEQITSSGINVELVPKPVDFRTLFSSINRYIAEGVH